MDIVLHRFDGFSIYQPKNGYHFAYEPFILTHGLKYNRIRKIVDFGSGCGIIAVIMALKYPNSIVYAVEKNEEYIEIIEKNFELNNINNATVLKQSYEIDINSIDLFISNPPYFTKDKFRISKKYLNEKFESESIHVIIASAKRLLKNKGMLKMSFHPSRLIELITALNNNSFGVKNIVPVYGNSHKNAAFLVIESKLSSENYVNFKSPVFLDSFKIL